LAGVGVEDPGDDLDQRRLAGAIVADERVHLVRTQREVALSECDHAPEVLLDVACIEQGLRRVHARDDTVVIAQRRLCGAATPASTGEASSILGQIDALQRDDVVQVQGWLQVLARLPAAAPASIAAPSSRPASRPSPEIAVRSEASSPASAGL